MKLFNYISLLFGMGCLITSCSSDLRELEPEQGTPMEFTCGVSRGTQTTDPETIGVMAYQNESETPDFMNNQLLSKTGQRWSYSPIKYWPESPNQLSFYAYSPYVAVNENETANGNGLSVENLKLTYQTPQEVAKHPDLLIAAPIVGKTVDSGRKISFSFSHVLACVSFEISNSVTKEKLPDQLVLKGIYTGGTRELNGNQWSLTETEDLVISYPLEEGTHFLMLLPQMLTDDSKVELKLGGTPLVTAELKNDAVTQWEAGKQYVYKLTIKQ